MIVTDSTIMPYGKKEKGKKMENVSPSFLIWWEGEKLKSENYNSMSAFDKGLMLYISENRDFIEAQAKKQRKDYYKTNY